MSWTRGFTGYALAASALVGVTAFGLTFLFRGPGDSRAIWITAFVAILSQLAAFPLIRKLVSHNLMVGWGAGSLVRFLTLGVYALIAGMVLQLPMTAALVSLALFYFVTSVIEPLFLRS